MAPVWDCYVHCDQRRIHLFPGWSKVSIDAGYGTSPEVAAEELVRVLAESGTFHSGGTYCVRVKTPHGDRVYDVDLKWCVTAERRR